MGWRNGGGGDVSDHCAPFHWGRFDPEEHMKKIAIAVATLFTAAAPAAFADHDASTSSRYTNTYDVTPGYSARDYRNERRYRDNARVIESRPLYAAGNAREECWNARAGHYEELRGNHDTRVGKGAAIGAIVGGVAGHQVGSGNGNTAATAGGALLGGLLGHQLQKRNDADEQTDLDRSKCRVIADNGAQPLGYDVRYEYQGREYVTRMDREPGQTLRVGRDIRDDGTPLDDSAARDRYSVR
jgi:uncharacterized protein YcfJ